MVRYTIVVSMSLVLPAPGREDFKRKITVYVSF